MEILEVIEKLGIPTFWGYLMYLLLKDVIKNLFNNFNEKMDEIIDKMEELVNKIDKLIIEIEKIERKEKEKV